MTTISPEISLESLLIDDSFYLFDRRLLTANILAMKKAFTSRYANTKIAYSFKTNYLMDVITTIREAGCMAEVVSIYELAYAKKLLFPDDRIVVNGVTPDPHQKFAVAAGGGYVNVDNYDEYLAVSAIAAMKRKHIRLGVRVNFPVSNGIVSRFGIDCESEAFRSMMNEMAQDPYVSFSGFHCHIGTARQVPLWVEKINAMVRLALQYEASYIDIGGGMFGPMPPFLSSQFQGYAGSFDLYAEPICAVMNTAFPDGRCMLILEPGTALVGNTMKMVATVTNIKSVRGDTFITVATNSNQIGMLCECRTIPVEVIRKQPASRVVYVTNASIVGNTCLEFDFIRKGFSGEIAVGDQIMFDNCGAYSLSSSRQFIVPRPPVYDAETLTLCREAEQASNMFDQYFRHSYP